MIAMPPGVQNVILQDGLALNSDTLAAVRGTLESVGYVYLANVPAKFDYVAELARLGEPVAQYGGDIIREVRPEPDIDESVYSASNTRELTPHTEAYEFEGIPPRYVALWCVQPVRGPGGETTLADGYRLVRQFTRAERQVMFSRQYEWRSAPSLAKRGVEMKAGHPILERKGGTLVVRYSNQNIVAPAGDELLARYMEAGQVFFEEHKCAIRIEQNDVLIWDNWRMMHARNRFADRGRHLRRILLANSNTSEMEREVVECVTC